MNQEKGDGSFDESGKAGFEVISTLFALMDRTDWLIHGCGLLLRCGLPKGCCWLAIERSGFMEEIERSGFMGKTERSGFMREEDSVAVMQ